MSPLLFTATLLCCARGSSIEGDVYLVMTSGDVRPGAGVTVHLLANADLVDSTIRELCQTASRETDSLMKRAEARAESAQARIEVERERARERAQEQIAVLQRRLRQIEDSLKAIRTLEERGGYAYFEHPTYKAAQARLQAARAAVSAPLPSLPVANPWVQEIPALRARLIADVGELLLRNEVARVKAGMDAHYRFSEIQAGIYYLYSETSIFQESYVWFARVTVTAGENVTRDLDNESLEAGQLFCGFQ